MGDTHEYRVIAWWASGRTGLAKSDSAPNSIRFTAPLQFGGLEGRWTPEDLLLCAIASYCTTTFRVLAENSKREYTDLQVEAAGTVDKADSGYGFSHIILRPHLKILGEPERARAFHLLQKAPESVSGLACTGGHKHSSPWSKSETRHPDEREFGLGDPIVRLGSGGTEPNPILLDALAGCRKSESRRR